MTPSVAAAGGLQRDDVLFCLFYKHSSLMSRATKIPPPEAPEGPRDRGIATWVFGGVLLASMLLIFFLAPERLPAYKQPIVPILAALLCGFLTFFLTGSIGLRFSLGKAAGGVGVFVLVLLIWGRLASPLPEMFHVHVSVVDSNGKVVPEAEVRPSVPADRKRLEGGAWELGIAASSLPNDRKITLYASEPVTDRSAQKTLLVREDELEPSVEIKLPENKTAKVRGRVLDQAGDPIAGVKVTVVMEGFETEAVRTDHEGGFALAAHVAHGQMVKLRAEKPGFHSREQEHPAGTSPAEVVLERD